MHYLARKIILKAVIKMFMTETHLHTRESSPCGWIHGKEIAELYKNAGYSTIFVCDHFDTKFFDQLTSMTWEEKINRFLWGYKEAQKAGDSIGLNVILCAEYMFRNSPNHYLVYGLTEEFLLNYPNILEEDIKELYKLTRENNMLLIQAHPFRGLCSPVPEYVDGMEIRNCNKRHFVETDEERTLTIAKENGLLVTAGSDAHRPEDIALSGVGSDYIISSSQEYIELLKSGKQILLKNF